MSYVAWYEDGEIRATEWMRYPIYHTDPFWNADLFDEAQCQDFGMAGPDFMVSGDFASDDVRLRAYADRDGTMLLIANSSGRQLIWLEPATLRALLDYIQAASSTAERKKEFQTFINATK